MTKYIIKTIYLVLLTFAFAYSEEAKAWSGPDCARDSARQENLEADKELNKQISSEIESLDALLKAKIGDNWQEILDKTSDRNLLGDHEKLGKGLGKIGGKPFLSDAKTEELNSMLSEEGSGSIDSVAGFVTGNSDIFINSSGAMSGELVQGLFSKRQDLYKTNLSILYAEALRAKKAVADGVFTDKINKVLDEYLKIPSDATVTTASKQETQEEKEEEPEEEADEEKKDLDLDILGVCSGRISSKFGPRVHPVTGKQSNHGGIDIAAAKGTDLHAAGDGTVGTVVTGCVEGNRSCGGGYGNRVEIKHANGYSTLYAHMNSVGVSPGQKVSKGQVIGQVGHTGMSTGAHLHLELHENGKKIDPLGEIDASEIEDRNNSSSGSGSSGGSSSSSSGDGPVISLAEAWRANSVAVIIQTEILLSLVELETQEIRTAMLRDISEMPLRLGDALGEKVQSVKDSDVTGNALKDTDVDSYADKLIKKDTFNFWK
ncbi:MAG: M23 family metallopeptidase [Alphaproteobacteria bacterium]